MEPLPRTQDAQIRQGSPRREEPKGALMRMVARRAEPGRARAARPPRYFTDLMSSTETMDSTDMPMAIGKMSV